MDIARPWSESSLQALPPFVEPKAFFMVRSWAPDGQRLAGERRNENGLPSGLYLYSFPSQRFERLAEAGV